MFLLISPLLFAQDLPPLTSEAPVIAQVQPQPTLGRGLFEDPEPPVEPGPEPESDPLPLALRRSVVFEPQEVRPLPGELDNIPVFNSNSPEIIRSEGILLSTFPPSGKRYPEAHLNFPFEGRFDIFAHHIAKTNNPLAPTLFLGILVHNPTSRPVTLDLVQAASFLGTPDAPFIELPAFVDNPVGSIYSGPGSRAMNQVLRGRRQAHWPSRIYIPPAQSRMLMNLPIPVPRPASARRRPLARPQLANVVQSPDGNAQLTPALEEPAFPNFAGSSNARSTLLQLQSSGSVYLASMAMNAQVNPDGSERAPSLEDWQWMLFNGRLAGPRDIPPTPLERTGSRRFFYGRVAGVSQGSRWQAQLTDQSGSTNLTIPQRGQAISYGLSTLVRGTFGTGQVQSAPMLVRYPDTAYQSHGNYAVHYDLTLPLYNPTNQVQAVVLSIQTPLKENAPQGGLRFLQPPARQVFFRGTVQVRYPDDQGNSQTQFFHLVQRRGQQGEPLVVLRLQPGERRQVEVAYLYPPDSTPPQVLTVKTLPNPNLGLPVTRNP